MTQISEILQALETMPDDEKAALEAEADKVIGDRVWFPSSGPQSDAYYSEAEIILFGGEPGGGKDLDINTVIPTPFGYTTMGELSAGDLVIDENGQPCSVVAKSEIFNHDCYKIIFSDGVEVIAGAGHQWVTSSRRERNRVLKCTDEYRERRRQNRPARGTGKRPDLTKRNTETASPKDLPLQGIRTTHEIYETLTAGTDKRTNHSIPTCAPLQLPEAELLVDPYVLGAWLGDGTTSSGAITSIDAELFQEVANYYPLSNRKNPITKGILGLQAELRKIGVLGNKHIPGMYLRASIKQRLSLLQGLMDTDGHANDRGQCEICLTRKQLIEDTHDLLSSLGIKSSIAESVATLNGRYISPKYTLKFLTELPAFRMSRKLLKQKRGGFRGTHNLRYIVDVIPVEPVPTQCIEVDSPNHMYLCGKEMIPTHNSSLLLGLAFEEHQRSLILRRQYTNLGHLLEEAQKFNSGKDGYNGSPPPKLKRPDGRVIDFGAASKVGDEQQWQGNPHDFIGVDEATQFAEIQIRFLMGWLRSTDPSQHKRVVFATNPPLTAEGLWVTQMFAPWIDEKFPNPAKPGELRWAILGSDDKEIWVDGPEPVWSEERQKDIEPKSYTFIPSSLSDNPFLADTGYDKQLDGLPEEIRSIMMGGFKTVFRDDPFQTIPTHWVRAAMERWTPKPPEGVPMCAIGVDVAQGGDDQTMLAPRHDGWFAPLIAVPGKQTPDGKTVAGLVVSNRRDNAKVIIDMGGGYGGAAYEHLKDNNVTVVGYKGAEKYLGRTADRQLKITNNRSAAIWKLREALDPSQPGGSPIMLPDDPEILADLTATTFEVGPQGLKVESKKDVCARLGRSTDKGDAIVMSWWDGLKGANIQGGFKARKKTLNVVMNSKYRRR